MIKVILDKGEDVRVWEHDTRTAAWRRANALAKLHSAEVTKDRDGDYYIDASEYYNNEKETQ